MPGESPITLEAESQLSRNARLAVITSLAGWTLVNLDSALFTFAYPLVQKSLHLSLNQISYIYTTAFALTIVVALVLGPLMDYWSRKGVFQVTLLATAFGSFMSGLGWNFGSMLTFRSICQSAAIGEWMSGQVMVAETAPKKTRGWWIGFAQIGWPLGWFFASLLSLLVVPNLGWRWLFIFGLIPALFTIWVRTKVKESERFLDVRKLRKAARQLTAQKHEDMETAAREVATEYAVAREKAMHFSYWQLFEKDLLRTTLLTFFWMFFINYGLIAMALWLPAIFMFHHVSLVHLYEAGLWSSAAGVFGYLSSGALGERLGRRETCIIYLVIGAFSGYMMGFHATTFAALTLFYSGYYFFGVGQYASATGFWLESFPTRVRGTAGSFLNLAGSAGSVAAAFTGPVLFHTIGTPMTVVLWTALCSIAAALLALGTRRLKPGMELEEITA